MQLTFPSNKSFELAFKVGIAGTSSPPQSVAVVLEKDSTALSFHAVKNNDEWVATIVNPGTTFGIGQVKVSVNVVLNNRLFTPMKSVAEILEDAVEELPVKVAPEIAPEVAQAEEIVPEEIEVAPEVIVQPKIQNPLSILKQLEKVQEEVRVIPEKVEPVRVAKPHKPFKSAEVKPTVIQEKVEITSPVKLQLLKSIEPGIIKRVKPPQVVETVITAPVSSFKMRKTKVVFE